MKTEHISEVEEDDEETESEDEEGTEEKTGEDDPVTSQQTEWIAPRLIKSLQNQVS